MDEPAQTTIRPRPPIRSPRSSPYPMRRTFATWFGDWLPVIAMVTMTIIAILHFGYQQ